MEKSPQLYGLVLAGGRSTRMGKDKAKLQYHGISQQEYAFQLLSAFCERVFISLRKGQEGVGDSRCIFDENLTKGPLNGMLSAHLTHPKVAWLVLACDTPLVDKETLRNLVSERDTSKMATAMTTQQRDIPEPLIAIWEPKGLTKILEYSKTSNSVYPTQFLTDNPVKKVYPDSDLKLANANHPEEYEQILNLLKAKAT
ncbi:MAG: NTP transferase domain-containing protein [Bacteroidota bacterium]